ncbi:sensor domain-containing diguanylate cyclase [Marinobacter fonticola]|uniref:sensor domain-containing diguanylate cyclase n=1 Tax=Marinobacter fonticola TaxID=2603215 RepID=UPI0011E61027|nr:sensor domain-containing diguanylate cyclase [Marinobacter fonticola]
MSDSLDDSHNQHDLTADMLNLVDAVQQLSLARDLSRITEIVRHAARTISRADGATFVLNEGSQCFYADEEAISPLWKGARFPCDACISGWVMSHSETVGIEDIYQDDRIPVDLYKTTFVKSMLMVPIRRKDPVGAIGLYWARRHKPSANEIFLMETLANSTAVAMENVRMHAEFEERVKQRTKALVREIRERKRAEEAVRQMAISDSLTGLLNRRGFFLQAQKQYELACRNASPSILIFADLDGLKVVNDSHGHRDGDQMLVDAGAVLKAVLRQSDVVARVGGDEFVVFSMECEQPEIIVKRIQDAVERFNTDNRRRYELALSVGVVVCDPDETVSLEKLMELADEAMYQDKQRRRNGQSVSHGKLRSV